MKEKEMIQNIFKDIDEAIENTRSDVPVEMKDSRFLRLYFKIKERYLK